MYNWKRNCVVYIMVCISTLLFFVSPQSPLAQPIHKAKDYPRVFIVGDSTVETYNKTSKPKAGWGQMLPRFFDSEITIKNYAIGGRSAKSFINEGRLEGIVSRLQTNDYLLIQFGHNDSKSHLPDRYSTVSEYKGFLKQYVNGARKKGATPILVTPMGRRDFNKTTGTFHLSFPEYVQGMKDVAKELDVELVDLSAKSVEYYNKLGPEKTKSIFLHTKPGIYPAFPDGSKDNTHFQEFGAIQLARLVACGIKELNNGLSTYVIDMKQVTR